MDLTPIFRIEKFLDAIINSTTPPEPVFRVEYFLAKIAGADVVTPDPLFRIEKYLAKILGEDVEIPEPMFRTEFWLAKKCGEDVETPDPAFRVEYWLEEWCGGSAPTYETITGRIVSFLTQRIAPLKIEASLSPIQDLHGYDAPWPPGGGKNILDPNLKFTAGTYYGGAVVATSDGYNITLSGTPTESGNIVTNNIPTADAIVLPAGTYTSVGAIFATYKADGSWYGNRQVGTWTADEPFIIRQAYIQAVAGTPLSGSRFIAVAKGSTAPTAWSPYSNECPITGHTGCDIFDKAEYDPTAQPTVTVNFGQTVYGGTLTVFEDGSGTVKARPYYASYNGETLVGPWVSSMDAYATGTTPTTGAQVVDMGGTETTIPLTPGQVNALQGQNVVWVDDSGEIKVTYRSN